MQTTLQNFSESDLPEIVVLHNKLFPPDKQWSLVEARAQLTDLARNNGKNVVLAISDGILQGVAGWVSAKDSGEFYGAPFFAKSYATALALLENLLGHAQKENAKLIRVGANSFESQSIQALKNLNFKKSFEFIEMEILVNQAEPSKLPEDLKFVPATFVDPKKYRTLYNASFKDVANAPAVDENEAKEILDLPIT